MDRGAKLLIVEGVYPPRIDGSMESRGAAANDVNMLVATGGRQRSEAEFQSLLAGAGFKLNRIVPTQARVSVIEGVPDLRAPSSYRANACARNSLTPARPVRLTHTGPDLGATSILNSRNGQHLRSKDIHSATCASAMRSVEI